MPNQDTVTVLGINGIGRIGKLTLWHHVGRKYFNKVVVNTGRDIGTSLADMAHYIERDSSYGSLNRFLHGCNAEPVITRVDEQAGEMDINGVTVQFLRSARNPADIGWRDHGVRLVVDTTGVFLDPTIPAGDPKGSAQGSIRGHLEAGAEKVVVSAPFKIKDDRAPMPEDAVTTVMGINENDYDPRKHRIISNASCTTTCLSHMIKPLLNHFGPEKILSASMATIHAATASQEVLDRPAKTGKTDLRKNRSFANNIILTTTGAAKALRLVIPEMQQVGFIAESVRVPVTSGSLIILVLNIQEEMEGDQIRRERIGNIYAQAADEDPNGYLLYTEQQNVSADIVGTPRAAAIIEGSETHTRTAEVTINLANVPGISEALLSAAPDTIIRVPVTQTVVYGWYDNELGSYVNMLGDRCASVAESLMP